MADEEKKAQDTQELGDQDLDEATGGKSISASAAMDSCMKETEAKGAQGPEMRFHFI